MAKEQNQKPAHCPNCNQPAIRQGNEIICELCDAVFKVTKADGARVKETGPLEEIQGRLAKLEGEVFKSESETKPDKTDDDDENEDW